ncbi:MAG: DUF58 domain-containing protein [Gemmataceae bacterium]|nr:DUF58 domain-containing protein [Gemmataceae bacterium]
MLDYKSRSLLKSLFLRTRKALEGRPSGPMKAKIPCGGMDFVNLREYEPGDEVRHIDWKSSSRSGKVLVKKFMHDQEISIQIFACTSASMHYSTTASTKLEVLAELATALGWIAINSGNRFSLLKFDNSVKRSIKDANTEKQVQAISACLLKDQLPLKGLSANLWKTLAQKQTPRSMVFVLSDFYEPIDPVLFGACAKKHDLHLIRILDPREITLPDTPDILCKNLGNNEPILIRSSDKDLRNQYLQLFAAHENKVIGLCKSNGAGFLRISTSEPYLSSLISYFNQTFKGYQ